LQLGFDYLDVEWEDPLLRRPAPMLLEGAERPGVQALRAEAYFGECAALARAERYPELLEVASELLELGRRTQNGRRQAEALAWLGVGHFELGDFEQARSVADACLDLARTVGSARAMEMSSLTRAQLHALKGELENAAENYEAIRHRTVLSAVAALCLRELGDLRCKQGHIRAAFAQHAEAVELARGALGNRAVPSMGWIYRELGAPGQALELDLQALACCPATDQPRRRVLLCSIAASHARLGDPARAQLVLKVVQWTEAAQKNLVNLQHDWLARCEIHLALEQHDLLFRLATSWRAAAQAHAAREGLLRASAFLARSAMASGDLGRAREQLEPALPLYQAHSMPLIGLPVLRYRQLVELQSGRRAAAEHARDAVEAIVERVASSIDDPALRRAFREMAEKDARSAPRRTSPRTARASARAT
jgi:Tfp pilus assembly protein PilF